MNKNHKAKGHRKVENRSIIKAGYITERVGNEPKLRKIVLANGIMICLRANGNDPKWKLPLAKITIEEDSRTEEIDINTRNKINKLGEFVNYLTFGHHVGTLSMRSEESMLWKLSNLPQ